MLRLLQNIKPSSALWVLLLGFLLRTPFVYLYPTSPPVFDSPFLPDFFRWIAQNPLWNNLGATTLVCLAALLLNRVCINQDVIYTHSYLPAWFYVLTSSMIPEQLNLHPLLFANVFILIGFNFLFSLFLYEGPSVLIYLTAMSFGAAAMFRLQLLALLLFLLGAIILMKRITLKDLLATLLGIMMPVYLLLSFWYLFGSATGNSLRFFPGGIASTNGNIFGLWPYLLCLLLVFLSFFKVFANFFKNNIRTRRINQVLIFFFAYCLIFILFGGTGRLNIDISLLFIPTAVFIAYLLVGSKLMRIKSVTNLLLLFSILISLYGSLLVKLFE